MVKEAPGVWGVSEMGSVGDGECRRWGVSEKLKNIYPHHYHTGLSLFLHTQGQEIQCSSFSFKTFGTYLFIAWLEQF
ncbi:MAG: hypothetical protein QNJ74_18535 [Trichodesmium sp. MO_231.B1]|nr:hypothetical protein [Trichodesmium sp. MO_231.B1]